MPTVYVASSNSGKLREFSQAAAPSGIRILPLPGLESLPEPLEDASTFAGNADIKARAYSLAAPGHLVLADDSGLAVAALGGRPGVLSARFAESLHFGQAASCSPPEKDTSGLPKDQRNNFYLLSLLHEYESSATADRDGLTRAARFVCTLSLARDGEILLRAEGTVEGEIIDEPRGSNGFGYDPLFLLPTRGLTLAQLTPEEKWSVSHRGNAFRSLLAQLAR